MTARLLCLPLLIGLLAIRVLPLQAQTTLPPCTQRAHWTFDIRTRPDRYCVERVWQDKSAGEMGFTGLAFAPDGRLFAARPLRGQVLMLRDTDGDTQPDSPRVLADGLDRPNALLYSKGALYIAGGGAVYRLPDDGQIETLTDTVPTSTDLWNGGLATDGTWLYVGTGAACQSCASDVRQGAILRVRLDDGAEEVFATGFRQPLALLWHDAALWATDSARPVWGASLAPLDELNRVAAHADYGNPTCLGLNGSPYQLPQDACDKTVAPILGLPAYSQPSAMSVYTGAAFPHLQGKLLMALMGSTNRSDVRGYGVIAFDFPPPTPPFPIETLLPYDNSITSGSDMLYKEDGAPEFWDMSFLNRRGVGVWPHHLYGMAISPEGWIYLSVGGGTILSLRPR